MLMICKVLVVLLLHALLILLKKVICTLFTEILCLGSKVKIMLNPKTLLLNKKWDKVEIQ